MRPAWMDLEIANLIKSIKMIIQIRLHNHRSGFKSKRLHICLESLGLQKEFKTLPFLSIHVKKPGVQRISNRNTFEMLIK